MDNMKHTIKDSRNSMLQQMMEENSEFESSSSSRNSSLEEKKKDMNGFSNDDHYFKGPLFLKGKIMRNYKFLPYSNSFVPVTENFRKNQQRRESVLDK